MVSGENWEDRGGHFGDSMEHRLTIGVSLYGDLGIEGSTREGLDSLLISNLWECLLVGCLIPPIRVMTIKVRFLPHEQRVKDIYKLPSELRARLSRLHARLHQIIRANDSWSRCSRAATSGINCSMQENWVNFNSFE
jgi:hypothetical protein